MSYGYKRMVFFVDWDREFMNFLKGITLSPSLRGQIVVHIFYPQDISQALLPNYKPWLFKHPSPKEVKDGSWKLLEDYVMKFKFCADYALTTNTSDIVTNNVNVAKECVHIISKSSDRSETVAKVVAEKYGVTVRTDKHRDMTLLDFMEYRCEACKIAFKDRKELVAHDKDFHGLLCFNPECEHRKKENSFATEYELKQHISSQMKCPFCPGKVFCTKDILEQHMKNTHKKCACPCGEYFGDRRTYLDHFFSYYPTPKNISTIPVKAKSPNKKVSSQFTRFKDRKKMSDESRNVVEDRINSADNSVRSSSVASTLTASEIDYDHASVVTDHTE